jgi:hypothetical protein
VTTHPGLTEFAVGRQLLNLNPSSKLGRGSEEGTLSISERGGLHIFLKTKYVSALNKGHCI